MARMWRGVIAIEGVDTADLRMFSAGSISWREPPLSLMAQFETQPGHFAARLAGTVDRIWRDGANIMGEGTFSDSDDGNAAEDGVETGSLRRVSVDMAEVEFSLEETGRLVDDPFAEEKVPELRLRYSLAKIAALTLVNVSAFEDTIIEIAGSEAEPIMASAITVDTDWCFDCDAEEERDALTAGLAPAKPPADWFADPKLTGPTPLMVTPDGQVFGHAAAWGTCHTGFSGRCVQPPHSEDYDLFHLGEIETAAGDRISVGQITLDTGHADLNASARSAQRHYDNTGTAVADVCCGEDEHGIWIAGAVRPTASEHDVRALMGAKVSGDWRPLPGRRGRTLVGLLAVNVPGFPVPRTRGLAAAGVEGALVAAGIVEDKWVAREMNFSRARAMIAEADRLMVSALADPAEQRAELAALIAEAEPAT